MFQQSTGKRAVRQVTNCPHTDRKYYCKGMCLNCYHSKGRVKLANACEHTDRKLYARGVCKACYLRLFQKPKAVLSQSKKIKKAED